jgi:hypothetical protein
MKTTALIIFALASNLWTTNLLSQTLSMEFITNLPSQLAETSGLVKVDGSYFTHNDSGDEPIIYAVNISTGAVEREIYVQNATHIDWEDVTADDSHIYIGDIGNNAGTRTDLKIYKVSKVDLLSADTVNADTITFHYTEQVDFSPATYTTNFDAESLIYKDGKMYLFTKNWGNLKTYIYEIPTLPGSYPITRIDSLNPEALITGASYNGTRNELVFTAYTVSTSFIYYVGDFEGSDFSSAVHQLKFALALEGSTQIEGITSMTGGEYLVSAEAQSGHPSALHRCTIVNDAQLPEINPQQNYCYPNPINNFLYVDVNAIKEFSIYDLNGRKILTSSKEKVNLSALNPGLYLIKLTYSSTNKSVAEVFIKR